MNDPIVTLVKNDMKAYNEMSRRIKELINQRRQLLHQLTSIGSGGYDNIPGNHESDIPQQDTAIIQKITNIDNKIEQYRQRMYAIDVFLDTCDEELSDAMRKIYLQGYSYQKVASEIYLSDAGLSKRIDKEIISNYC